MAKKAKNSKPQSSAATEAPDKTTSAAPAGSQEPATNSAAEAEEASGSTGHPFDPSLPSTPAEPSKAPAGVTGASGASELKAASIVVRTRPGREQTRYRIGCAFTHEETVIALADLTKEQLGALYADRDLVVTDHKPSQEV
jgi:hypothetical protein